MKIKTKALATALNECGRAMKTRTTMPILNHVQIGSARIGSNLLVLRATSLDVWVELEVECDGDMLPCCVSHSLLLKMVEFAGTEEVELNLSRRLEFRVGKSTSAVKVMAADEFPRWPEGKQEFIAVNPQDLADGIESVSWTTIDSNAGRPNLENVHVALSPQRLECVAYNARVIAFYQRPAICGEKTFQMPRDFTPAFVAALRKEEASVSVSSNYALCTHKNGRTLVKLSELPFPDGWRGIFVKREGPSARLDPDMLKIACSRTLAITPDTKVATLCIDWQDDHLSTEAKGDGNEYVDDTEVVGGIGEGYAQLSAAYLLGALPHLGETIQFTPADGISFWASGNLIVGIGQLGATPSERVAKKWQADNAAKVGTP